MKVDKAKLAELLAEKTGLTPEAVNVQLDELAARVHETSERGKALEINGFGMFYFSESGELVFDPAEDLKTEINYKYAGMKPVEIRKSSEAPDTSAREKLTGTSVSSGAADEKSAGRDSAPEPVTVPDSESGMVDAVAGTEPDREIPDKDREDITDPDQDRKESYSQGAERGKKVQGRKNGKSLPAAVMASVVIVLILILGLFALMDRDFTDSVFGDDNESQELTQAGSRGSQQGEITRAEPEVESAQESDLPAAEDETAEWPDREQPPPPAIEEIEVMETARFGLEGTERAIGERYYSIILHSVHEQGLAEELRDEFREEGYRSVVTSVNVEEMGVRWRVGIGQFESIPDAQEAAAGLPQDYRDNHFIGVVR